MEDILPEKVEELIPNLQGLRDTLKVSFEEKVSYLNEVTKDLINTDRKSQ